MLSNAIAWIESHPNTVELGMWLVVLAIGWFTGLYRWIWRKSRKPRMAIVSSASRVLLEEFDEMEGTPDVVRASFLLKAEVSNASTEKVVIEGFELTFRRRYAWKRYGSWLGGVSLPNRPRLKMGAGEKAMPVFFTNFDDGVDSLTLSGVLDPKDFCAGYLLFVSFTYGSWNPLEFDDKIKVRLRAHLTSGGLLRSTVYVTIVRDKAIVEELVPGIIDQITHITAWNVPT